MQESEIVKIIFSITDSESTLPSEYEDEHTLLKTLPDPTCDAWKKQSDEEVSHTTFYIGEEDDEPDEIKESQLEHQEKIAKWRQKIKEEYQSKSRRHTKSEMSEDDEFTDDDDDEEIYFSGYFMCGRRPTWPVALCQGHRHANGRRKRRCKGDHVNKAALFNGLKSWAMANLKDVQKINHTTDINNVDSSENQEKQKLLDMKSEQVTNQMSEVCPFSSFQSMASPVIKIEGLELPSSSEDSDNVDECPGNVSEPCPSKYSEERLSPQRNIITQIAPCDMKTYINMINDTSIDSKIISDANSQTLHKDTSTVSNVISDANSQTLHKDTITVSNVISYANSQTFHKGTSTVSKVISDANSQTVHAKTDICENKSNVGKSRTTSPSDLSLSKTPHGKQPVSGPSLVSGLALSPQKDGVLLFYHRGRLDSEQGKLHLNDELDIVNMKPTTWCRTVDHQMLLSETGQSLHSSDHLSIIDAHTDPGSNICNCTTEETVDTEGNSEFTTYYLPLDTDPKRNVLLNAVSTPSTSKYIRPLLPDTYHTSKDSVTSKVYVDNLVSTPEHQMTCDTITTGHGTTPEHQMTCDRTMTGHVTPPEDKLTSDTTMTGHVIPLEDQVTSDTTKTSHVTPPEDQVTSDTTSTGHVTCQDQMTCDTITIGHVTPPGHQMTSDTTMTGHITPPEDQMTSDTTMIGHVIPSEDQIVSATVNAVHVTASKNQMTSATLRSGHVTSARTVSDIADSGIALISNTMARLKLTTLRAAAGKPQKLTKKEEPVTVRKKGKSFFKSILPGHQRD